MPITREYSSGEDQPLSLACEPRPSWTLGGIVEAEGQGYSEASARREALRRGRTILATEAHSYVNHDYLGRLADEDVLTRTDWRVLWRAVSLMEPGNYLYSNASLMSEVLGISYVTVLGSWRKLREMGLLGETYNRFGRLIGYRVNPEFAWRGRPWKASAAQQQYGAQQELDSMAEEKI